MEIKINENRPVLSICMIVKNEERCLARCLNSMQPLINAMPSEIIIADTGSTDKTREIAESFGADVFYFEWCNDFASARNSAILRSNGEWILIIDADEWFEDVDALIEFFNVTSKTSAVEWGGVYERDLRDSRSNSYDEHITTRFWRSRPGRIYSGEIHESLPIDSSVLMVDSYMYHDGYIDNRNDVKSKRNLPYLEKQLEKDPDNIHYLLQLSLCYGGGHLKKRISAAKHLMAACEAEGNLPTWIVAIYLLSISYANMGCNSEVIETCKKAFAKNVPKYTICIDISVVLVLSYVATEQYEKALAECDHFYELLTLNDQLKLNSSDRSLLTGKYIFVEEQEKFFCQRLDILKHLKKYDTILSDCSGIYWFKSSLEATSLSFEFEARKELNNWEGVAKRYYDILVEQKEFEKVTVSKDGEIKRAKQRRDEMSQSAGYARMLYRMRAIIDHSVRTNPDIAEDIGAQFAKLPPLDKYIEFMHLRYEDTCEEHDIEDFSRIFSEADASNPENGELLYFALKWGVDYREFISRVDFDDLTEYLKSMAANHSDLGEVVRKHFLSAPTQNDPLMLRWETSLLERILLTADPHDADFLQLFERYARGLGHYVHSIYAHDLFDSDYISLMPHAHRFGHYALAAFEAKNSGDDMQFMRLLTKAHKVYPAFNNFVQYYSDEMKAKTERERDNIDEYTMICNQLKEQIRDMISGGKSEEAAQTLEAYQKINPHDNEIVALRLQMRVASYKS